MSATEKGLRRKLLEALERMAVAPAEARRVLRQVLPERPRVSDSALAGLVRELVGSGRAFDAVELASAWVERAPRAPLVHLELGRALLARAHLREDTDGGQRDRRTAMKVLRRAAELDPASAEALDALAEACASSGDPDGYVDARWKYLEAAGSQEPACYVELGRTLVEVDPERAMECFRRAIAIDPSNPEPYDDLYAVSVAVGDEEGADETLRTKLEEAVEDQDDQIEGFAELLTSYGDRAAWGDVVSIGQRLLDLDPENLDALTAVGSAYAEEGDYAEALEYLEKAIEIAPDDSNLRTLLSEVQDRMGA